MEECLNCKHQVKASNLAKELVKAKALLELYTQLTKDQIKSLNKAIDDHA